jgi:chorismate dehydratase
MWDFDHLPLAAELAKRYEIDWMLPSACADRLADGIADIGLVPIASLAATPGLRIIPGCTIASKQCVRSLLLVHSGGRKIADIRTVAADTASRTTIAYSRLLFRMWGNPNAEFLPMAADVDSMLARADAAIVIGDPALLALEEHENREERTGEQLVYRDLAHEWRTATGLPFISAVWAAREDVPLTDALIADFTSSRDRGLAHIEDLAAEWADRVPIPESTIRTYLESNIHYVLDDECKSGMREFFRIAAEANILPPYNPEI